MARRTLKKEDLRDLIYGSAFYAGGGGGNMADGEALLELLPEGTEVQLCPMAEMEWDVNVVSTMVAAMGSPVATAGMTFSDESVNTVRGMIEEARSQGKDLRYIYSGEQGGANTMLAPYTAAILGLPLLDTDANGRAVPELTTGLAPIHGIPTSPVVMASGKGDLMVLRTEDPLDSTACEALGRQMADLYRGIGFAAWLMNRQDHEKASAVGQITLDLKVGAVLRRYPAKDILEQLIKELGHFSVFVLVRSAVITKIEIKTEMGFDYGITTLEDDDGNRFTVHFQNENLYARDGKGKVLLTVPDMITLLNLEDNRPLSNSETKEGQKVMVLGIKAHAKWNDAGGYECWDEVLRQTGYAVAGPRVPLLKPQE